MTLSGSAHRSGGATYQLSPSARFTLAAALLALGIGDLAVINLVLLPRHFAVSRGIRPPPLVAVRAPAAAVPVDVEGASAAAMDVAAGLDVLSEAPVPALPPGASGPTRPPPPPLAALAPSTATGSPTGDFPDLLFARNTTWLSRPSREGLDRVVESLKEDSTRRVVLSGHTDDVGPTDLNRALSKARARRASRYLQARGIEASQIEIRGLGPAPPVKGEPLSEARARNRRVEIAVQ